MFVKQIANESPWESPEVETLDGKLDRAKALMETTGALLRGDFTLSSGSRSSYYLDSKMFSLDAEGARLAGELLYELIRARPVKVVGGMAHSAIPLVTATVIASREAGAPLRGFYVRNEAKEHGTQKLVEGYMPPSGSRVAVIDDVITTGTSVLKAIAAVEQSGCIVDLLVALIERHEGGGQALRDRGYEFVSVFRTDEQGGLHVATPSMEVKVPGS